MKKTLKVLLCLSLVFMLVFCITACTDNKEPANDNTNDELDAETQARLNRLLDNSSNSASQNLANGISSFINYEQLCYNSENEFEISTSDITAIKNYIATDLNYSSFTILYVKPTNPADYKSTNTDWTFFVEFKSDSLEITCTSSQDSTKIIGHKVSDNGVESITTANL